MAGDEREVGERLDVLDQRRPPPDAAVRRARRGERGLERAAVEVAHQRGLLAGEVVRRHRHDAHTQAPLALADRGAHRALHDRVAGGNAHDRVARADRGGSGGDAVEHELRCAGEQHAILGAHRLGLDAVGDDDLPAAAVRDRGELARHRERGAAAPGDAGAPHRVDDRAAVEPRERPVDPQVLVEPQRARGLHAGEQAVAHPRASRRALIVAVTGPPLVPPLRSSTMWTRSARPRSGRSRASSTDPSSVPTSPM